MRAAGAGANGSYTGVDEQHEEGPDVYRPDPSRCRCRGDPVSAVQHQRVRGWAPGRCRPAVLTRGTPDRPNEREPYIWHARCAHCSHDVTRRGRRACRTGRAERACWPHGSCGTRRSGRPRRALLAPIDSRLASAARRARIPVAGSSRDPKAAVRVDAAVDERAVATMRVDHRTRHQCRGDTSDKRAEGQDARAASASHLHTPRPFH